MRDIATTTLSGNLTREVELHELPSGVPLARLRIASTSRQRHFTVEVYGEQARACAHHLGKGSHVVVEAELDWREWSDEQNHRRKALVFRARQVLVDWARPV
jgi:single-stranded DNA-binding protein